MYLLKSRDDGDQTRSADHARSVNNVFFKGGTDFHCSSIHNGAGSPRTAFPKHVWVTDPWYILLKLQTPQEKMYNVMV